MRLPSFQLALAVAQSLPLRSGEALDPAVRDFFQNRVEFDGEKLLPAHGFEALLMGVIAAQDSLVKQRSAKA